jgi:hypothetical protein
MKQQISMWRMIGSEPVEHRCFDVFRLVQQSVKAFE